MGKKKETLSVYEKSKRPLSVRLQSLVTNTTELANFLGCSVQAVNQYKQGISVPHLEKLIKIADFYNVSVDYLLGITDAPSRDNDIQSVCKFTGLSQNAAIFLNTISTSPSCAEFSQEQTKQSHVPVGVQRYGYTIETTSVLSDLIESKHFHELFNSIELYLISAGVLPEDAYKSVEQDLTVDEYTRFHEWAKGRGLEIIPRENSKDLYLQKACDVLKDICKEMLEHGKHSREKE